MLELWQALAGESGRELPPDRLAALERYLALLAEGNAVLNLAGPASLEQGALLHVADALTLLPHIPAGTRLLADIGSGGGVPGIPLAIALPEVRIVLIEATGKKAGFLRACAGELGLANVEVRAVRAEDAGRSDLREVCDVVTARAVGGLVWLAEWCLPLARLGGRVLAMKGPKLAEEIPSAGKPIRLLGGGPPATHPVRSLPSVHGHVICVIEKVARTPDHLPRPATSAKGKPLR